MTGTPRKISIAVATYRRPEGLRALLRSIDALDFDETALSLRIVVVDNAPDMPAVASADEARTLSRFPVDYVVEPQRGIVMARNRALQLAKAQSDLIAFVDDDETVTPGWLRALVDTMDRFDADAVQGPVEPNYETPPQPWIEALKIFRNGPYTDGAPRLASATNNVLLRTASVRAHGLAFDPAFNLTGGEDEDMFSGLVRAGGRIVASAQAVVYDEVPASRMTVDWARRREFRKGNTLGRIALKRKEDRLERVLKGFASMARGALWAIKGAFSQTGRVRGWLEINRGAGMLAAFLDLKFAEYSDLAIARDRKSPSEQGSQV